MIDRNFDRWELFCLNHIFKLSGTKAGEGEDKAVTEAPMEITWESENENLGRLREQVLQVRAAR